MYDTTHTQGPDEKNDVQTFLKHIKREFQADPPDETILGYQAVDGLPAVLIEESTVAGVAEELAWQLANSSGEFDAALVIRPGAENRPIGLWKIRREWADAYYSDEITTEQLADRIENSSAYIGSAASDEDGGAA